MRHLLLALSFCLVTGCTRKAAEKPRGPVGPPLVRVLPTPSNVPLLAPVPPVNQPGPVEQPGQVNQPGQPSNVPSPAATPPVVQQPAQQPPVHQRQQSSRTTVVGTQPNQAPAPLVIEPSTSIASSGLTAEQIVENSGNIILRESSYQRLAEHAAALSKILSALRNPQRDAAKEFNIAGAFSPPLLVTALREIRDAAIVRMTGMNSLSPDRPRLVNEEAQTKVSLAVSTFKQSNGSYAARK